MEKDVRTPREAAVVLKERIENAAANGDVNNYLDCVQMVEDTDLPGEHAHALTVAIEEGQERIITTVTNAVVSAKVKLEHDAEKVKPSEDDAEAISEPSETDKTLVKDPEDSTAKQKPVEGEATTEPLAALEETAAEQSTTDQKPPGELSSDQQPTDQTVQQVEGQAPVGAQQLVEAGAGTGIGSEEK